MPIFAITDVSPLLGDEPHPAAARSDLVSTVTGVHTVLPPHGYAQEDLTEAIADLCLAPGADRALMRRLHMSMRRAYAPPRPPD